MSAVKIHSGWTQARLDSVAQINQGGRRGLTGKDFTTTGYPAYGAGGVNGLLPEWEFDEPAIILSAVGARCGKCFFAEGRWVSLANTQVIRPDPAFVDPRFLWYQLNDESSWRRSGTGQPFIKPSDVKGRTVLLPPLVEQRRIAAILDAADELRAKRRATITALDDLSQSIFLDMFGDGAHLDAAPLSAVAQVRGGLTVNSKRSALPNRAPYLRVANVGRGVLDLAEIKTIGVTDAELEGLGLERDDLLLVEGHGNRGEVGRVARWTGPIANCVHQNHLIRIRLDQRSVLPVFAEHYLNSRGGRAQVAFVAKTTSGLNTISISQVRALKVPLPRMSDQRLFAERAGSVADQVAMAQESLRQLDFLFASLQGHAFRGDQAR